MSNAATLAILVILVLAASFSSTSRAAPPGTAERIYRTHCSGCHGPTGEGGRGPRLVGGTLERADDLKGLVKLIEDGIDGTEMPYFGKLVTPDGIRALAVWILSKRERSPQKPPGDPANGEQIFRTKAGCPVCHAIRGEGGVVGPDLGNAGIRAPSFLRRMLLEPDTIALESYESRFMWAGAHDLPYNHQRVELTTAKGESIVGVRLNEDSDSIQVRDLSGQLHSFFKSELTKLALPRGVSVMPSYKAALSDGELDDLIAFLSSLRKKR